jgi:2-amino-4-hydroxy-6-hydroxymethyldihydropteridine diphosphokinase
MPEFVTAYLALGSNLGDRQAFLDAALARLRLQPGVEVERVSTYHETDPVGGPAGQGQYLNAAAQIRTSLEPMKLLRVLLAVESQLGRVRAERFGPRTIDLDLLLYGTQVLDLREPDCELILPHPRLHERRFVLAPLVEIAPLAVHPVLQSTVKDLLARLKLNAADRPVEPRRELQGQNAVVTGSTSGIGRAIALALADAGANVLIHGRRSQDAAHEVSHECRQKQVEAACFLTDLRDENQCAKFFEQARKHFAALDIWINNAGADTLTGALAKLPFDAKLQELWAVDVRATMQLARAAGEFMKAQGRGVILNMGWDQAETGMAGDSGQLFGACKGAVMAFTMSLALSLAPQVRVNCLAPGWIRTAWGEQASAAWQERVLAETPLQRWGTPEDVAQTARWLVSPAAHFITGQIIRINGGAVR